MTTTKKTKTKPKAKAKTSSPRAKKTKQAKSPPRRKSKMNDLLARVLQTLKPPENLTVSEWADRYRILSTENSAEAGKWRTARTPYLREIMDAFTDDGVHRIVLAAGSQVGKALALDTPLPTPNGWTTMGALKVGDVLFDEKGKPCRVLAKTDVMKNHDCYRVRFSDGAEIVADAAHRWAVEADYKPIGFKGRKGIYSGVVDTAFIAKEHADISARTGRNNFAIKVAKPLRTSEINLKIKPYTLGVWLGDGHAYSNQFCGHVDDLEIVKNVCADGYNVELKIKDNLHLYTATIAPQVKDGRCKRGHILEEVGLTKQGYCAECARQYALKHKWKDTSRLDPVVKDDGFITKLRAIGVFKNKHIPREYLRASEAQRWELLQGVMDTDGCCNKNGRCEITLKSKDLFDGVKELILSLGLKPTTQTKFSACNGKRILVYRLSFVAYKDQKVFKLKRKQSRLKPRRKGRTTETFRRRIVSVEKVESVPVQCIAVDSPSHLFLAGKNMIPTHNSEMLLNMIGYAICEDPASIMFVQPSLDTAEDFSKRRISPMIRDTPKIKERVASGKAKAGDNTIYKKTFLGGMLTITGSNSPSSLASIPARYVLGDERDRWAISAGAEGDPFGLLLARTTTFFNRKIVETSTPTIKGASAIASSFELGTQERWCSQCPHCETFHNIVWRDIKFDYEEVKTGDKITHIVKRVEWQCPHCGERFTEIEMRNQPQKWIAENPEALKNGIRSFWLNAFTSPWVRWEHIVLRWLQSKDDPEKLKVVFNTLLGELWEIRANTEGISELLARREEYETEVPEGVIVLTCGVDTQDDRLEYEVVGHGYYGETWGIEKGIILGRPDDPAVWQRFDELITREFKFTDGNSIRVAITFVDSGGHFTQEVYRQCLIRQPLRVFAIKGKGGQDVPFVTQPSSVAVSGTKRKAKLFVIGVDAGKEQIAWSLNVKTPGARYMHFPKDEARGYDANFFTQLTSEHLVPTRKNGRAALKWDLKEGYTRNEALDCRNYALAAFRALNPDLDAIMRRRKKTDKPRQNTAAPVQRPQPQRETFSGFSGGFETQQFSRRGNGSVIDDFSEW